MITISDINTQPTKRKPGRPRKNPEAEVVNTSASTIKSKLSASEISLEQKLIYDIVSIFKKVDPAKPIIEYRIRDYTLDELERFLDNPIRYSAQLGDVCHHFYSIDGFFRELIDYYVKPALYRWTVNTAVTDISFLKSRSNPEKFEKDFITYVARIKKLGFDRELKRVLLKAHLEDVVYGWWLDDGSNVMLYSLPQTWCKLSGKANGNWVFVLNTSAISQKDIDEILPDEIASLVKRYKGLSGKDALAPVPAEKGFCIKYNDHVSHIIPPFIYVLQLVIDLIKLKQLGLIQSEQDVINLIEMLVPSNKDKHDDILFTKAIVEAYADGLADLLGNGSTLLPTPMKLQVLPTAKATTTERNSIINHIKAFGEETGMPSFGGSNTAAEMKRAIENAQSKVFTLMDQISGAINLKMQCDGFFNYRGYDFTYQMLHMNQFNKFETQDALLKQAQFGAVSKFELEAARGRNPAIVLGQHFAENVVFRELFDNLTVPPSSHTRGESEGGRPAIDEDNLSPAGEQTRGHDNNNPSNRDG